MISKETRLFSITKLFKERQAGALQETRVTENLPCSSRGVGQPKEKMFSHSTESSGCNEHVCPKYLGFIESPFFPVKITLREMLCFFHFMPCNEIVEDLHTQELF